MAGRVSPQRGGTRQGFFMLKVWIMLDLKTRISKG